MNTAREYLAGKGLAIAGARGKFSKAAHEELARALSAGMKFSDWPKSGVATPRKVSNVAKNSPKVSVTRNSGAGHSATETEYLSPSDFRFPEEDYIAKGADGKTYSMRECCNTCKVSLTNHMCNDPSALGVAVTIVRR